MKITVAICTWNRANLLDRTLDEMQKLKIPKGVVWELLVVNNNCTDNTDKVIVYHINHLPIRRVFESNRGLSNARNAAVRESTGDYMLWTDDDVLVDEYWVEAYVRAFERWPEAAIFGGPIAPWFEGTPPKWLEAIWPKVANAYAVRDLGPDPIPISEKSLPFGANYAVSLPFQKQYIYDPALGRKGKGMLGYEESTLILAMLRDGLQGFWVPGSKVRHFIPRDRQKTYYLRRYFHGQGVFWACNNVESETIKLFGYPRWLIRAAVQSELQYYVRKLFCGPDVWIKDLIQASMLWGQLQGCSRGAPSNKKSDSVH
jgi:glycosyltransferase involved in cell wall biosynthesis